MQFPTELRYQVSIADAPVHRVTLNSGLTTFVGPNGSGKTQILRSLKLVLPPYVPHRAVRLLPAGRLAYLEGFRSDQEGRYGGNPNYEGASFGGKDYQQRRHLMEGMLSSFHALGARPDLQIKVAERLRCLFGGDVVFEWDTGMLRANFVRLDSNGTSYSSAREASGLLQLVTVLPALYDDEVGALLIDEPEVSLHPQLQSFILREIQGIAGDPDDPRKKLVLMATHSTEMIDLRRPEDLTNIVFCCDINEDPKQIEPSAGELQNRQLRALVERMGKEHKLTFFCDKPVLLEGPSDLIISTGIDRSLGLYLEAAGAQPVPVIGKGQMPTVAKLMRLIGKSPILVADADAIADNLDLVNSYADNPSANMAATRKGARGVSALARSVYTDFCELVKNSWNDIAAEATNHPYWLSQDPEKDELKYKRRAALATLMSMSDAELKMLPNTSIWTVMRQRLTALLDVLESAGCFILRRGTIESYYQFVDELPPRGKPSAAVEEVDGFSQEDAEFVERNYPDLVRALKFAATTQPIKEAKALRDILLAVATTALGNLSQEVSEDDLNLRARRIIGEKVSILKLSIADGVDGALELIIDLNSPILNVECFPIRLRKGTNPIVEVDRQLGIEAEDS